MTKLVTIALYHRDTFSSGRQRQVFGYSAFHWGVIVVPKGTDGRVCGTYEASDANRIDLVTYRMDNPTMAWKLRTRADADPMLSKKLLGRIVIGEIPETMDSDATREFFESIPLPKKNTNPQESCVSWVVDAIKEMQQRGWAREFQVEEFKDWAVAQADQWMTHEEIARKKKITYYSAVYSAEEVEDPLIE